MKMKVRLKDAVLFLSGQVVSLMAACLVLFWPAGRLDWPEAWLVVIFWIGWFATEDRILFFRQPDLLKERMFPPRGASRQDRMLVSLIRLMELARYLLAGFDRRSGWTGGIPMACHAGSRDALSGRGGVVLLGNGLQCVFLADNSHPDRPRAHDCRGWAIPPYSPPRGIWN
jgi:hypothetical protein